MYLLCIFYAAEITTLIDVRIISESHRAVDLIGLSSLPPAIATAVARDRNVVGTAPHYSSQIIQADLLWQK